MFYYEWRKSIALECKLDYSAYCQVKFRPVPQAHLLLLLISFVLHCGPDFRRLRMRKRYAIQVPFKCYIHRGTCCFARALWLPCSTMLWAESFHFPETKYFPFVEKISFLTQALTYLLGNIFKYSHSLSLYIYEASAFGQFENLSQQISSSFWHYPSLACSVIELLNQYTRAVLLIS